MRAPGRPTPSVQNPGRWKLSGSVLTHPARGDAAARVLAQAPPGALSVVTDPMPSGPPTALRTALAAWESIRPPATHHLVVQDDMILSAALFERARLAIEARPHAALALFSLWDSRNGGVVRLGALSGARWVTAVNEYTPCAALILPRAVAAGYVDYVRRLSGTWPEDIMMSRYLRSTPGPCLIAVPNLAEHDDLPSIAGNDFRGPRRSACFVPSDRAGGEDRPQADWAVVPFFKTGTAQCVVRLQNTEPARWLHLRTAEYLRGLGAPARDLHPRLGHLTKDLDPRAWLGTWLTGYVLGHQTAQVVRDADAAVFTEALRTIAVGGMSHYAAAPGIHHAQDLFAEVAVLAVQAGRAASLRPRDNAARLRVLGANNPFGEHVVRLLADRGHPLTVVSSRPPDGVQPGVRYVLTGTPTTESDGGDALLDLRELADGQASASARTVVIRPAGRRAKPTELDVGHLYGPGCGPNTVIGAMVWSALQSQPIEITDDAPAQLRPCHIDDLVDAVRAVISGHGVLPSREYPVRQLAEIVTWVRPTPIRDMRTAPDVASPPATTTHPDDQLKIRLHHFSQWLAYEYAGTAPTMIT